MPDLVKEAFAVLKEWPLVQGAVAILVLVIASLLAWATLRKQFPPPSTPPALPPPAPVPIQIESPWLVQHLVEMHYEVEQIRDSVKLLSSKLDGVAALLKRRAARHRKSKS